MKKILTLFAALVLLAVGATAQKLSYQAVVRNSTTNELVPEATVSVSLKILADDGVTVQYAETQTATTNQNGVLSLIIGEHPTGTYTLDDVNWENASIKTEITLPSGDVVTNTMPVTAVPYALFAKNASEMPDVSNFVTTEALENAGYLTTETDPNVNDATLSVQIGNGNPVQIFSANASEDAVITIPEMPDVSNFVTTEALENAGYLTTEADPTVKDATLSVQIGNGNPVQVFSANASEDAVITIPEMPDMSSYVTTEALQNAGYLTSYTETQNLADVTANGNSAGNRQLKNVSDPTDAQDAVTKNYLTAQMDALTASIQQQLNSIVSGLQHQIDSLGGVVSAQQATIDQQQATIEEHQAVIDSIRNSNGGTTPVVPTVTTGDATSVTETSATLNATITNPDNVTITAIGFSYNASGSNTHMSVEGTGNGNSFTVNLTGLTPGTEYSYHAFIVTDDDVMYDGGVKTFTTTSATPTAFTCGDNLTVGNYSYTTNQYGSQCWMTQNLRTVSYPAVLNACPDGWRLPDNNDWGTLGNNLPSSNVNFVDGDYWTSDGTMPWADDQGNTLTLLVAVAGIRSNSYSLIANGIACDVNDVINCECMFTNYCIAFRCVRDESSSTTQAPTVTTNAASNIAETTATLNATITNPDNVTITPTGFEYMATGGTAYTTVEGSGNGTSFTTSLTGLTAGTEYTYRAYITYDNNKVYGSDVTFTTTSATPTAFTCGDNLTVGNYSYTTNQYGSQCWMTQNLRNTDGSYKFEYPNIEQACPTGWHLPDGNDWGTLGNNLPSSTVDFGDGDYWTTSYMPWSDGVNEFTLIPPPYIQSNVFYSTSGLACDVYDAARGDCTGKLTQIWVRCLRDESGSTTQAPTVTTGDATSVTQTTATLNATISNPDNVTITAIGFSYNASGSNSHMAVEGTGNGNSFTVNLTGLTPGTEYSYHAFIVTDDDVMYDGGVKTFTTTAVTPTTFTCGDDLTVGNYSYTTNQYGSQCWMTQNLRNANGSEVSIYWPEVLTACPTGWHLPNQEEWNNLGNNLPSSPVNFGYGEFWTATTTPYEAGDGYQFTTITPPIVQNNNVSYNYYQLCDVNDYGRSCFAITGDNALYASFIRCVLDEENAPVVSPAAVGDILLEDDTWVSPNDFNATTMTAKGVIFHVDETGQHGWAVNLHDEQNGSGFQWSSTHTDITDIPNYDSEQAASADTAGYQNTQAIRLTGDAQTYPAAYAVSITDGWYLPASGQLFEIMQNKTNVNNSLETVNGTVIDDNYELWSSTESDSSNVWAVYISWNLRIAYDKVNSLKVRSIRSF